MKEKEVLFELSECIVGQGISPTGIESHMEKREILEKKRIGDDYETKSIVTITGYLNDTIEMVVKWNEEEFDKYKHHQKVLELVRRVKVMIRDDLKIMFLFDDEDEIDQGYEEVYSQLEITSYDRQENHIYIWVKGVDDRELAEFGGLDVQVKAVKHLISNLSRLDFHQEKGEYPIERKIYALYLNEIGKLMRNLLLDQERIKGISNMDLVKQFMAHWQEESELVAVIDKDNEEIRREDERYERRQRNINNKIKNR
jgi:hypothetical protein